MGTCLAPRDQHHQRLRRADRRQRRRRQYHRLRLSMKEASPECQQEVPEEHGFPSSAAVWRNRYDARRDNLDYHRMRGFFLSFNSRTVTAAAAVSPGWRYWALSALTRQSVVGLSGGGADTLRGSVYFKTVTKCTGPLEYLSLALRHHRCSGPPARRRQLRRRE